jgi:hypothetical protein
MDAQGDDVQDERYVKGAWMRRCDDVQDERGRLCAPLQLLLHWSDKLHPCNDAQTTLPPFMAVVCHGRIRPRDGL